MAHLSICESCLLCVLNEKGRMPALSMEIPTGFLAGALFDLILSGSVAADEKKKLHVVGGLKAEHRHLNSLFCFLQNAKPMKAEKLVSDYIFELTGNHMKQLFRDAGESLADKGCAEPVTGGLFGNTPGFLPKPEAVDRVVQGIRAGLLEEGGISDDAAILVSILEKSGQLKKYFSSYEKDALKTRLKEIKNTASHKMIKEMIDYIDMLYVVMITASSSH